METFNRLRGRSFGGSGSSDGSTTGHKDLQPILAFTTHIDELKEKYIGRNGNGEIRPYIPSDELKRYWTKPRVSDVSRAHQPYLTIKFDAVSERCLQLFSILVYIDKVQYFATFLTNNISDTQLPLKQAPRSLTAPVYKDVVEKLLEHQWLFCPVPMDYALLTDVHLEPSHILPFYDEVKLKDGDAAQIFRIRVHKSCNRLHPAIGKTSDDAIYVLKSYSGNRDRDLYRNESKALTTLQAPGNKNIVGYYGSFIQNGTFNLLLQYADGGNLLDYFNSHPRPQTPGEARRFWRSLFNVFKGLQAVHQITSNYDARGQYMGIHEDIKPDNIILNKGTSGSAYEFNPMLADFGHSHFRAARPDGNDEMGEDHRGNQTYGAPECSRYADYLIPLPDQIPTAADIFSIGCVISDAAAWVAFGPDGRAQYYQLRMEVGKTVQSFEDPGHYDCFHDGVDRSTAVDDMHQRVRNACHQDDTVTRQVLDLVQNHMLLRDWKQRLTAKQLHGRFLNFLPFDEMEDELKRETQPRPEKLNLKGLVTKMQALQPVGLAAKVQSMQSAGLGILQARRPSDKDLPTSPSESEINWRSPSISSSSTNVANARDTDEVHLSPTRGIDSQSSPKIPPRPTEFERRTSSSYFNRHLSSDTLNPYSEGSTLQTPNLDMGAITPRPPTPVGLWEDPPSLSSLYLSLFDVQEWRRKWKDQGKIDQMDPKIHGAVKVLQNSLRGRDHIFYVDNAVTMKEYSESVKATFATLAYIVKPQDSKDEASLILAWSSANTTKIHRKSKTKPLIKLLDECSYDRAGYMLEHAFGNLVDDEIVPRLPDLPTSVQSPSSKKKSANPLSVIILTDGRWGSGADGSGIQNSIKRLIDRVVERDLRRTHVMVQFLRFGDDENAIRHLKYLVEFGRENKCDIVDTNSINGNVCAMLTGSISGNRIQTEN